MLKQNEKSKSLQMKIGQLLSFIPLSPNQWTLISLLLAFIGAYEIITGQLVYGLALFALSGIIDMVDGAVARARGETTKFGGFLDGVCDRLVEALFLISLMFYPLPYVWMDPKIWLAMLIFIGTCMPAYIRAYAAYNGVISVEKARAMGGLFERSERIILLFAGMLAGIFVSMDYFIYAVIAAIVLSAITVMQRIIVVMRG
ncbi:CDP-alcohol phosphatidyltransferase family protein [Candidatus Micrarchaeota archaeon]|nr:CDP-alcohol phosphatidyltransferase family protein [Candidatus Micrarchaeota archaeon]